MKSIIVIDRIGLDHHQSLISKLNESDVVWYITNDKFYMEAKEIFKNTILCNTSDYDALRKISLDLCRSENITHVVALSEKHQEILAEIRSEISNKKIDYSIFRDKMLMKEYAKEKRIPTPEFGDMSKVDFLLKKHGKIIIKPRKGMGSENIYSINSTEQISEIAHVIDNNEYMCEEFIDGEMYHADCYLRDNDAVIVVSKYMQSTLSYKSGSYLSSISIEDKEIEDFSIRTIKEFGLSSGVFHVEVFRGRNGNIYLCEIAKRAGGAGVVPAFEALTGINLHEADICLSIDAQLSRSDEIVNCAGWICSYTNTYAIGNLNNLIYYSKCNGAGSYSTDYTELGVVFGDNFDTVSDIFQTVKKNKDIHFN